jgi:hypothetical protein
VAVSLGTFQIGQTLGVSSAIAVLIAGLVIGYLGLRQTSASGFQYRVCIIDWSRFKFAINWGTNSGLVTARIVKPPDQTVLSLGILIDLWGLV